MANFTCSHIVLAGGRSRRLGGVTKALLLYDGQPLLEHAVAAAPDARDTVVVGPPELPVPERVRLVREDPPFGGPVAGIAAGLAELQQCGLPDWILITACDHPRARDAVAALFAAAGDLTPDELAGCDAVVPTDSTAQRQILFALYRSETLAAALTAVGGGRDVSVRRLLAELRVLTVLVPEGLLHDVDDASAAAAAGITLPVPETPQ